MATKKKKTGKKAKARSSARNKAASKRVKKPKRPLAKAKAAQKKKAAKAAGNKSVRGKKQVMTKKPVRSTRRDVDTVAYSVDEPVSQSGEQAGDLQGLSGVEGADSESVQELLEEGNAFEADVVTGVEKASEAHEVRTHEVLEDDVPGEYLDEE